MPIYLVSIPMWMCLHFSPIHTYTSSHTPNTHSTPNSPTPSISVAPPLVGTYIYLGSLTFSFRPDEAASVWRQQKLVLNNYVNNHFVTANRN